MSSGKDIEVDLSYPNKNTALPIQEKAHLCNKKVVGIKGGYGSAKTYWLCMEAILDICQSPKSEGLLGRLTAPELRSTVLPVFFALCPEVLITGHNKNEQVIRFWNGYLLHYISLDDSKGAFDKIKSFNLGWIGVDQLEELSGDIYFALKGRLRNPRGKRRFRFTANPEGHNWIWKRWVSGRNKYLAHEELFEANAWKKEAPVPTWEQVEEKALELKKDASDLTIKDFPDWIQYTDNFHLPIDYLIDMLSWPDRVRNRYVFGSDEAFEGLIYDIFDEKIHLIPDMQFPKKDFVFGISLDHGKRNPTSIGFWAVDRNGNPFRYDEIYVVDLTIPQIKLILRAKLGDKKIKFWVADPSIFKEMTKGQDSVASLYANKNDESGWAVHWQKADNNVDFGIDIVLQYLRRDQTGNIGNLYVVRDKNPNWIEEIEDYRWKDYAESMSASMKKAKNRLEKPRKYNDHAMDDTRYALITIWKQKIRADSSNSRIKQLMNDIKRSRESKGSEIRNHMVA